MDACADEAMYQIEENEGTPGSQSQPAGKKTPQTLSGSKSHKRKRLRENLAQLASEGEVDTPMFKRKSVEVLRRSLSVSFLDATADTSTPLSGIKLHILLSPLYSQLSFTYLPSSAMNLRSAFCWYIHTSRLFSLYLSREEKSICIQ